MIEDATSRVDRRRFLATAGTTALAICARSTHAVTSLRERVPRYLGGHAELFATDPRAAARKWFAEARYGLFMHYGLYSQLARGEWVMLRERIPIPKYMKLKETFTAGGFDADFITDMALDGGMRYVNITSRHHDGFCLFETAQHDYHARASPARRDLVGELAEQCGKKGLGLFLYYSYAADWWHPWFYDREAGWANARPAYETRPDQYRWRQDEDFRKYVDYVHAQLKELRPATAPWPGSGSTRSWASTPGPTCSLSKRPTRWCGPCSHRC